MTEELEAFRRTNTWDLAPLPFGVKPKYIPDILERATLSDPSIATTLLSTLMEMNLKLCHDDGDPLSQPTRDQKLVGALVYLPATRSDRYAVHILSQFVSSLTFIHYAALIWVLRYLRGTITQSLFFPSDSSLSLHVYYDAGWADDADTRHSTTGFFIFLGSSLISWRSKNKAVASRSSTESKYRALANTTVELKWLHTLL
ncbi:uncharacterized protein LOC109846751 [Asparagus officinalis]|uniref:uncharacterized protein LOC109846751 n=1 Tax=Asparagus officinalis TaxID=4686 RepID=UPI00098E4E94|nr:uncharacterized protein LOC109846751 [Asparagus officinalis]